MGASAKRKNILKKYLVSDGISELFAIEGSEEMSFCAELSVPKLCETRWSASLKYD